MITCKDYAARLGISYNQAAHMWTFPDFPYQWVGRFKYARLEDVERWEQEHPDLLPGGASKAERISWSVRGAVNSRRILEIERMFYGDWQGKPIAGLLKQIDELRGSCALNEAVYAHCPGTFYTACIKAELIQPSKYDLDYVPYPEPRGPQPLTTKDRIRYEMQERELTSAQLARMIGVSRKETLRYIHNGRVDPNDAELEALLITALEME